MCIYSSDASAAETFYAHDIGATKGTDPQDPTGTRYYLKPDAVRRGAAATGEAHHQ